MPQVLHRPRSFHIRALVGGVLYIEGIIVLLLGATMLFGYWPPYPHDGKPRNPISMVGLVISCVAVAYMIIVSFGYFIYSLFHPAAPETIDPLRLRAHRYKQMGVRSAYLFDETLECEADADEAHLARQLF